MAIDITQWRKNKFSLTHQSAAGVIYHWQEEKDVGTVGGGEEIAMVWNKLPHSKHLWFEVMLWREIDADVLKQTVISNKLPLN